MLVPWVKCLSGNGWEQVQAKSRELEMANTYKSEFLSNMSHELRTPLNSLLILARLLTENGDGNLTEEQVESSKMIYEGGQELLSLINEILDLAKIEAGKMELHLEALELILYLLVIDLTIRLRVMLELMV